MPESRHQEMKSHTPCCTKFTKDEQRKYVRNASLGKNIVTVKQAIAQKASTIIC